MSLARQRQALIGGQERAVRAEASQPIWKVERDAIARLIPAVGRISDAIRSNSPRVGQEKADWGSSVLVRCVLVQDIGIGCLKT